MKIEDRIQGERAGWEGNVRQEYGRLHTRFSHVFLSPNSRRAEAEWEGLADQLVPNAHVLELGVSTGASAEKHLARRPKRMVGIDIIDGFVEEARQRVPGAEFISMDAHRTSFADASFDVVTGRAILHHLEFEVAVREINRLLKPGGTALFIEPLRDNPGGKLFRALTPLARTRDEAPLSRQQIEWADQLFGAHDHRYFGFASTGLGLLTSLTSLPADNGLLRWADRVDTRLASSSFRYWMRMVMLVWKKAVVDVT